MKPAGGWRYRSQWSRRPLSQPASWIVLVLLVLVALAWHREQSSHELAPNALSEGSYRVQRVVDGDTLLLVNGARVRMLAINAPESVKPDSPVEPFGPEASDFTRSLVDDREVHLRFDRDRIDRFGRFLAYVWVDDPKTGQSLLVNEELVRAGLAKATLQFDHNATMERRLSLAEQEARRAKRGIWSIAETAVLP